MVSVEILCTEMVNTEMVTVSSKWLSTEIVGIGMVKSEIVSS